jgi:hypothetical protein
LLSAGTDCVRVDVNGALFGSAGQELVCGRRVRGVVGAASTREPAGRARRGAPVRAYSPLSRIPATLSEPAERGSGVVSAGFGTSGTVPTAIGLRIDGETGDSFCWTLGGP